MKITFDSPSRLLHDFYNQDAEEYKRRNKLWSDLFKSSNTLVIEYEDMDRYISISDPDKNFEIKTLVDDYDLGSFLYDKFFKPLFLS